MSLGVTVLAVTGSDDNGRKRYGTFFVPEGTDGYTKGQPLRKLGWHARSTPANWCLPTAGCRATT